MNMLNLIKTLKAFARKWYNAIVPQSQITKPNPSKEEVEAAYVYWDKHIASYVIEVSDKLRLKRTNSPIACLVAMWEVVVEAWRPFVEFVSGVLFIIFALLLFIPTTFWWCIGKAYRYAFWFIFKPAKTDYDHLLKYQRSKRTGVWD